MEDKENILKTFSTEADELGALQAKYEVKAHRHKGLVMCLITPTPLSELPDPAGQWPWTVRQHNTSGRGAGEKWAQETGRAPDQTKEGFHQVEHISSSTSAIGVCRSSLTSSGLLSSGGIASSG